MNQNDFHERLKKIEAKSAPARPVPIKKKTKARTPKPSRKFPFGLAIASFLMLGSVGGGAAFVATNPEAALSMMNSVAKDEQDTPNINIVDGVPYAQIKPETPIMQRLPKETNLVSSLFSGSKGLEINQRFHAPQGWVRVTYDDVNRVTPLQQSYLQIESANSSETMTKLLNLTHFASKTTGAHKGGMLGKAINQPLEAIYFGPRNGILVLDVVPFGGRLSAPNDETSNQASDTLESRYARLKDAGFRTHYMDYDVDGVTVAVNVPKNTKVGIPLEQLAKSGQTIEWDAFVLPNYNRQLKLEGRATVGEFKALIRSIGQTY